MDLLQRMNQVVEHIESNLTNDIQMESLAKIAYCSVYDFSRVFSFVAGMSVSDYIRRRRLSQAVFDIQNGNESIVDIAFKYCYESQSAFTRSFKELHGQTPATARKKGISLKTYPKITFKIIIKGVIEMDFRIVNMEAFEIMGYSCTRGNYDDWLTFGAKYNNRLWKGENGLNYYDAPFWQVGAYKYYSAPNDENKCIIGAELRDKPWIDGMDKETIPAATWAVFTFVSKSGSEEAGGAFNRIMTEWLPSSNYKMNESIPNLEVYPDGDANSDTYKWEIWLPILNK